MGIISERWALAYVPAARIAETKRWAAGRAVASHGPYVNQTVTLNDFAIASYGVARMRAEPLATIAEAKGSNEQIASTRFRCMAASICACGSSTKWTFVESTPCCASQA